MNVAFLYFWRTCIASLGHCTNSSFFMGTMGVELALLKMYNKGNIGCIALKSIKFNNVPLKDNFFAMYHKEATALVICTIPWGSVASFFFLFWSVHVFPSPPSMFYLMKLLQLLLHLWHLTAPAHTSWVMTFSTMPRSSQRNLQLFPGGVAEDLLLDCLLIFCEWEQHIIGNSEIL